MVKIVTVTLRDQKISPRKARLSMNLIKNLPVTKAFAQLKFLNKKHAELTLILLRNGIDAAEKKDCKKDDLYISEAICNEGKKLKRIFIRARGRSTGYVKRMSHLKISLSKLENKNMEESPKLKGINHGSKS